MRCKNCGTYNDDNRYICETCGSPLYDEDEINNIPQDTDKTQTFNAVKTGNTSPVNPIPPIENEDKQEPPQKGNHNSSNEKKSIIVIAILAVILVAIIASIIVVAQSKKHNNNTTEASTSAVSVSQTTTEWQTERKTTERTTERTTQRTTKQTTTQTTTQIQTWIINASSSGGGTVSGEGEYKNGKRVVLTATPDNGYEFSGWYANGVKVSSSQKYSFSANENASFTAVFNPVEDTTDDIVIEE